MLTDSLDLESPDNGTIAQIQFIDESRRRREQRDTRGPCELMLRKKLVDPLPKEEWVLKQKSQTVSQAASTVGQAPEVLSRQRVDQTAVRKQATANATVSSPTCRKPGQEKRSPKLVRSSVRNSARTS